MYTETALNQDIMRNADCRQYQYPIVFLDETFIRISDFIPEVKDHYFISNYGRVCSFAHGHPVIRYTQYTNNGGYVQVTLPLKDGTVRNFLLHRVLMLCFHPISNPDEMAVNHKDGIKYHNYDSNLEWTTDSENMIHCYRNNLEINGEDHPWATITEAQAHEICKFMEQGYPNRIISEMVFGDGDHSGIVRNIRSKNCWVNVSRNYNIDAPNPGKRLFTDDEMLRICRIAEDNPYANNMTILRIFGIDISKLTKNQANAMSRVVRQLKNKSAYTHLFNDD